MRLRIAATAANTTAPKCSTRNVGDYVSERLHMRCRRVAEVREIDFAHLPHHPGKPTREGAEERRLPDIPPCMMYLLHLRERIVRTCMATRSACCACQLRALSQSGFQQRTEDGGVCSQPLLAPHDRSEHSARSVTDACEAQVGDSSHMAIPLHHRQRRCLHGLPVTEPF